MKKFLMVAAMVAVVAAPAFAGMAPMPYTRDLVEQDMVVGAARTPTYESNSATHIYDNYQRNSGVPLTSGPDDVIASFCNTAGAGGCGTGANVGAFWNRLSLSAPGSAGLSITQLHLRIVTGWAQTGPTVPLQIGFYSVSSAGSVGTFLNTIGANSAFFSVNVTNAAAPTLFNLTVALPTVVAPSRDIWIGFASAGSISVRAGIEQGTQIHGGPGDAFPALLYAGSGSGVFGGFSGAGLASPSGVSPFITAFTTSTPYTYINNFHLALGGTPEPTTAMLLGAAGLFVLRRRKA